MKPVRFTKMQGIGNDFMVIDAISQSFHLSSEQIAYFSDRQLGVGFDQLLVVEPPTDPNADFFYRTITPMGRLLDNAVTAPDASLSLSSINA